MTARSSSNGSELVAHDSPASGTAVASSRSEESPVHDFRESELRPVARRSSARALRATKLPTERSEDAAPRRARATNGSSHTGPTHDIDLPPAAESGVIVSARNLAKDDGVDNDLADDASIVIGDAPVTLVVTQWHNVEPGVLSWTFPSFTAALTAAGAMRNAVAWKIVAGSVDAPREGPLPDSLHVIHERAH